MILTDAQLEQLGSPGWLVADGFLGAELALRVRREAEALPLKPAGVRRGADHRLDPSVRGDAIAWITPEDATGAFVDAVARFEALMQELNERAWQGLRRFELQLARYEAGGHYARHRDAFPGDDNRRITAIVYLNPAWTPADGGLLRIHGEPARDVEPRLDRLVVFRSSLVEHEVLPSQATRWALAAWYSAKP